MFIRNKDLRTTLGETFNIDISLKQLDRIVKTYQEQSGLVINRIWNENKESRLDFVTYIKEKSINLVLKPNSPLPKNYHLCGNPYKYETPNEVEDFIKVNKKDNFYMVIKCGKCKKYHMVKKNKKIKK